MTDGILSGTVELKCGDLIGPALDWAVARAAGVRMFEMGHDGNWPGNYEVTKATQVEPAVIRDLMGKLWFEASLRSVPWSPSTDWAQGGPLIDKYRIGFAIYPDDYFAAIGVNDLSGADVGPTHLIAACRAIVAAHLGEVVSVPAELVENK